MSCNVSLGEGEVREVEWSGVEGGRRRRGHSPNAAVCFLAFSLRSAMLEFLLVFLAAAAAATTEAAEADSAASVARGRPNGGAGNIM